MLISLPPDDGGVGLLDVILPAACAGCGRYGAVLCDACRADLRPASSSPADRFLSADPGAVVGDALELAIAAFRYEGPLRRALGRLKYDGMARAARPLARAALPALRTLLAVAGDAPLVPIPLHATRLRQRGYNQAQLLARELGLGTDAAVLPLLVRDRPTTRQHQLDRAGRLRNLREAFHVAPKTRPPPSVILVDDILTTGATLEACASILRAAGAEHVYGFCLAREV